MAKISMKLGTYLLFHMLTKQESFRIIKGFKYSQKEPYSILLQLSKQKEKMINT
jgi:hypothetical protein